MFDFHKNYNKKFRQINLVTQEKNITETNKAVNYFAQNTQEPFS